MRYILLLCLLLLPACATTIDTQYLDGMRIRTVEKTNMFSPSLAFMEIAQCNVVHAVGLRTIIIDKREGEIKETVCEGQYAQIGIVHGTQPGAMTGIFGAMIQGGAMAGSAALIGDGLKKSGDTVNQSGGGANSNAKANARSGNKRKYRK